MKELSSLQAMAVQGGANVYTVPAPSFMDYTAATAITYAGAGALLKAVQSAHGHDLMTTCHVAGRGALIGATIGVVSNLALYTWGFVSRAFS